MTTKANFNSNEMVPNGTSITRTHVSDVKNSSISKSDAGSNSAPIATSEKTLAITLPSYRNPIFEETGYEAKTTFWSDFSIADAFGASAVRDTFERAFNEWRDNYIYLTELVMVLNHKIWQWHERSNQLEALYDSLWREADDYALDHLTGDELRYYYNITD